MYVCKYVAPAMSVYVCTYCRCLSLSWNFLHEHSLIFRACWVSCPHCCLWFVLLRQATAPVMPHHPFSHAEGQTNTSFSAACVSKCCENRSKCDHLWLLHGKCYSVKCFSAEMCTPVETELPSSLIKMSPSEWSAVTECVFYLQYMRRCTICWCPKYLYELTHVEMYANRTTTRVQDTDVRTYVVSFLLPCGYLCM